MTTLVQQRAKSDCGICCIAMALGRGYEEVLAAAKDDYDPSRGLVHEQGVLRQLGLDGAWVHGEPSPEADYKTTNRGILSHSFFRSLAWGRRALMTVPSLNIENSWHMIYWDGQRVWDPHPNKQYAAWIDLKPDSMTLFSEAKR